MKEIGPIPGTDCKNSMTENKSCGRKRLSKYSKNDYEREYYHTFQDYGNRRKYKDHYKNKYRDEHFYDSDRSYDTDNSQGRDRSYSTDRDRSLKYKRDR